MAFTSLNKHRKNAKQDLQKSYRNKLNRKNSRKKSRIMKKPNKNRMSQARPSIQRRLMMTMCGVRELTKRHPNTIKKKVLSLSLKRSHQLLRPKKHKQTKNLQRICRLELWSFRQRSSYTVSASTRVNKHPRYLREGMELWEPMTQIRIVIAWQMIQERGEKCWNYRASVKMSQHQRVLTEEVAKIQRAQLPRTPQASREARSQWRAFHKPPREVMKVQSREVQQRPVDPMVYKQTRMRQVSNFKENWSYSHKMKMPKSSR